MDGHTFHPLTVAELEERRAALHAKAERLDAKWRAMNATTKEAAATGRHLKALRQWVADYDALLKTVHGAGVGDG